MRKRTQRTLTLGFLGLIAGLAAGGLYFRDRLRPMPVGKTIFVRYERNEDLATVMADLAAKGVVRDGSVMALYARVSRQGGRVSRGTYSVAPGLTAREVLAALARPVRQMVRLPETNWARRSANLLERAQVTSAKAYMELFARPDAFAKSVEFPLKGKTLEGYLFPDTYDLPPLLGARGVIERQLQAFHDKVWEPLGKPKNLHQALIIGSLVELEVAKDVERPIVAGVILNRLKKGMRLQIDASINYGIQKWRPLTFADYRNVDSPYNLYRNAGLPPGPICSPSRLSVEAALKPAKHEFLYYVAMPGGYHLFAKDFDEHRRNIQRRRKAIAAQPK